MRWFGPMLAAIPGSRAQRLSLLALLSVLLVGGESNFFLREQILKGRDGGRLQRAELEVGEGGGIALGRGGSHLRRAEYHQRGVLEEGKYAASPLLGELTEGGISEPAKL